MKNIRATWPSALPLPTWPSSSSTPPRASWSRPAAMPASVPSWGSATSSSPSTRWTWPATARNALKKSRPRLPSSATNWNWPTSSSSPFRRRKGTTSPRRRPICPGTRGRPSSTIWKRSTSKKTKKKAFTCPSSASAARTTPSAASRARSKAAPWPSAIRLRPCPARKKLRSNLSSSASIPSIRLLKASRSTSSSTAKSTYPGAASLPRGRTSP